MDHELVKRSLGFARRRKKWIGLLAAFGISSYAAYRVYHLPSVTRKRKRLVKLLGALVSVLEMASDSAETISLVSNDLKEFLQSDTDEIPRSLKQISKIARSQEFSQSVSRVTKAFTVGIIRGYKTDSCVKTGSEVGIRSSNYADKVMDRLLSSAGTGFASVVVGSFARNLVLGFYSSSESVDRLKANGEECLSQSSGMLRWLNVACDDKCKELIGDCIQKFVSTAVAVYLDKTMSINTYDEILAGLTNPKHQDKVQDILVSVCNSAIETLIRTSHRVLTSPDSGAKSSCSIVDQTEDLSVVGDKSVELEVPSKYQVPSSVSKVQDSGWANKVSSTLAVPSNRRFVLDVTGRVTFETIRSILLFLSWKLSEGIRMSLGTVHEEVILRGLEVVRFISAKSSIIFTLCLALYLHVLGGTRVVLTA
ncbi:protein PHLOEM PROTEIN 2-LIKE A10 [Punica granatum]|uniref:Uncharacterized protein n=2 Tax=Punica granatum TaxID=22663 RepID=A0A218X6P0_PUNGR|nr:protein PHLOEM PROTEIN 2-LIKE A10 [Punica granatum]OWM80617.1 hypothetical protein CDL15_Pgr006647 [Punica granatum]PKI72463.1 hypothetical protein CRG98_007130 [Punica granatum]